MQNKKGFSFIELILILVFFFLILAALMPMVTRRHLTPPGRVGHGTYACYWKEVPDESGTSETRLALWETLLRGKHVIKDEEVGAEGCKFEAPRKANYFYVQMIGGGGAGRDLNWATEVDPTKNEKYRIKGHKTVYGLGNTGYFVNFDGHNAWTDDVGTIYSGLNTSNTNTNISRLGTLFGGWCTPLSCDNKIILYLHGKSEDGKTCMDDGSCPRGIKDGTAVCRTPELTKRCDDPNAANYTLSKKNNKYTYSFECEDKDGLPGCDVENFCESRFLTCSDNQVTFNSQTSQDDTECTNAKNTSGFNGYVGTTLNSSVVQAWARLTSDTPHLLSFKRFDQDHVSCSVGVGGEFTGPFSYHDYNYGETPYDLSSSDKWNSVVRTYYNKFNVVNPRMPKGNGVWFTKRVQGPLDTSDYVFKLCGGWGAEKGIIVGTGDNRRTKNPSSYITSNDKHCAPAYGNPPVSDFGFPSNTWDIYPGLYFNYDVKKNSEGNVSLPSSVGNKCDFNHFDYNNLKIIRVDLNQSQIIPYGVGGRAGELKTLIMKSIPEDIEMVPGQGGIPSANEALRRGQPSRFGSNVAQGGEPGKTVISVSVPINPYNDDNTRQRDGHWRDFSTEKNEARYGGTISFSSFVKLIISRNNNTLRDLLQYFGQGGDGAFTKTDATCGYSYRGYALYDATKNCTSASAGQNKNNNKGLIDAPYGTRRTVAVGGDGYGKVDAGEYSLANTCAVNKDNVPYYWHHYETSSTYNKYAKYPSHANGYDSGYYSTVDGSTYAKSKGDSYHTNVMARHALRIEKHATAGHSGAIVISW